MPTLWPSLLKWQAVPSCLASRLGRCNTKEGWSKKKTWRMNTWTWEHLSSYYKRSSPVRRPSTLLQPRGKWGETIKSVSCVPALLSLTWLWWLSARFLCFHHNADIALHSLLPSPRWRAEWVAFKDLTKVCSCLALLWVLAKLECFLFLRRSSCLSGSAFLPCLFFSPRSHYHSTSPIPVLLPILLGPVQLPSLNFLNTFIMAIIIFWRPLILLFV